MDSNTEAKKPHAVFVPYPAQGHINPMLKLAKLLHHKGFHITFVNTEYNHKRLIKSRGPESVKGLPDFQFKTIPDGLPPSDANATQDIPALCDSTSKTCLVPFRELVINLNNTANLPSVSCIVSDGIMSFTLNVAEELGIPEALFWTLSACGFMGYQQYPHLVQSGVIPFKDDSYLTDEYLERVVHFGDEIKDIRLKDLPSFIRTTDNNDIMLNFYVVEVERTFKTSAVIILNTFDEFEKEVLSAMKSKLPPIYTIGPLHLIVNDHNVDNGLKSNLWKEDTICLEWLDSKKANSVVYVNFGSITVMTPEQMIEFAWGLANSNCNFLWVKRPDLVVSDDSAELPAEFIAQTKERGLLVHWCPQEQVLNHPSIGGFLTHSGWNSTIESVSSGVPMLCWPFFAEQQMNCRFACTHWGIGMEIDSNVKRDDVENLVRELMEPWRERKVRR